jgi:hypothetical protein
MNDFAVVGVVDKLGRGRFGFVVKQVDRGLLWGRLTTLRRWCRVGGDGLLWICSSGGGSWCLELGEQGNVSRQNYSMIRCSKADAAVRTYSGVRCSIEVV